MNLETTERNQANTDTVQLQGRRYLARPFDNWGVYRNPTPRGMWSTVQFDANAGTLQVQLGRRGTGNSNLTIGYQFAAWETQVAVDPRTRFFAAVVKPTTLVVRPNGGVVTHWGYMELRKGNQAPTSTALRLHAGQPVVPILAPNAGSGSYRFRVGVYSRIAYQGTATPYGEVIASVDSVFQHTLGASTEGSLLDLDEGFDTAEFSRAAIEADADGIVRPLGDEPDVASAGIQALEMN